MCRVLVALVAVEAGDAATALGELALAASTFEEVGEAWGAGMAAIIAARAHRLAGGPGEAIAVLEVALAEARRAGNVGTEARLLVEWAAAECELGRDVTAAEHARAALTLVRSGVGDRDTEIRALVVLAVATERSSPAGARLLLEEAVGLLGESPPTTSWRQAHAELARVLAPSDPAAALLAARVAVGEAAAVRSWVPGMRALAAALEAAGDVEEAAAVRDELQRRLRALGVDPRD